MDDWVSIDEKICLPSSDMLDDELAIFLDRIDAYVISVFMEQCFSGGFIDDLSVSNRVISTATEEETVSWGNLFVELFTSALHRATRSGSAVDADNNHNGHISMREAFNYAAENDYYNEIPQYDDNGDDISHPYPIPQGGDGDLGAITYLESFPCVGDFDYDGDVDGSDLAVFAADFGRTDCANEPPCKGDFDEDGDVDGSDLAVFAADFGRTDCL